jgi:hypothetical protein
MVTQPPKREGAPERNSAYSGPRGVRLGGGGWVRRWRASYAIRAVINGEVFCCPRK